MRRRGGARGLGMAALLVGGLAACGPTGGGAPVAPAVPAKPAAPAAQPPAAPTAAGGAAAQQPSGAAAPSGQQPAAAAAPAASETVSHTLISPAAPYWPTWVGQAKGFFAARGITLDVTITPRIPDAARALASGSYETGGFIPDTALLAVLQGAPITLVGTQTERATYKLAVSPATTSYADLRGKTLAAGAVNDVTAGMLIRTLRQNGVAPGEYELVAVGSTPERYAALTSGQAAGVLLTPPIDVRAEREGYHMLANLAETLPPYAYGGLLVNRDWAAEHRDTVARWLAGMLESVRWLYDPANRAEAVSILMDVAKSNEEDTQIAYGAAVEGRTYPTDLRTTRAQLDALIELMREVGTAPDPLPDLDRFLDNSYLDAATRLAGPAAR
ncbi:MAG TPA: ABC transporter substrate-binding protein [Chloroflexota bacterium]|nr:ABC transporter substrate-binding protein [Chloroflexota bacterium]